MFQKIKFKLLFCFLLLAILPVAITMYWFYQSSVDGLKQRTYDQLKTVRETKRKEIESYFRLIRQQAVYFASSVLTLNALNDFTSAFANLKEADLPEGYTERLHSYYKDEFYKNLKLIQPDTFSLNKLYPSDYRSVLLQTQYLISNKTAFKPNVYNEVHERYHNAFSTFCKVNGFYDVFLIEDETGFVIYSVNKEVDFATSLLSDAHANSNLGKLFRKVRFSGLKYQATMCDFEPYLPSGLAPAAFIASPIYNGEKKVGTLVFQVPIDKINEITTSHKEWREEGLGVTGESYIVGADCKMRTDSRFIIESPQAFLAQTKRANTNARELALISFYKTTVLFLSVCNESVTQALGYQSGTLPVVDYRGVNVLSSHAKLDVPDVRWVFLAEMDEQEALAAVRQFARNFIYIGVVVIALVFVLALYVAHTLTKPIRHLANATVELGNGNLHVSVEEASSDELGLLQRSFNTTVQSLRGHHANLLEKQEEITLQSEQLILVNNELYTKNSELDKQKEEILKKKILVEQQKEEIMAQAENLMKLNAEVTQINTRLESVVRERTQKLYEQNEKLADYAFANAHKLRGPLTRIMGLINVIHIAESVEEKMHFIELLNEAGKQLDEAVHTIQKLVAEKEDHGNPAA